MFGLFAGSDTLQTAADEAVARHAEEAETSDSEAAASSKSEGRLFSLDDPRYCHIVAGILITPRRCAAG